MDQTFSIIIPPGRCELSSDGRVVGDRYSDLQVIPAAVAGDDVMYTGKVYPERIGPVGSDGKKQPITDYVTAVTVQGRTLLPQEGDWSSGSAVQYSLEAPNTITIDAPGMWSDQADHDRKVRRHNFYEFVRVLVNGGSFVQVENSVQGSACSDKAEWRSRLDVIRDAAMPTNWMRNTAVPGENEIELGHKPIGGPPTP